LFLLFLVDASFLAGLLARDFLADFFADALSASSLAAISSRALFFLAFAFFLASISA
jgi:hypothetical protein